MANPTKALNTKLQKLIIEVRESACKPAFGPNAEQERKDYHRAMYHLSEFVIKYGDRIKVDAKS